MDSIELNNYIINRFQKAILGLTVYNDLAFTRSLDRVTKSIFNIYNERLCYDSSFIFQLYRIVDNLKISDTLKHALIVSVTYFKICYTASSYDNLMCQIKFLNDSSLLGLNSSDVKQIACIILNSWEISPVEPIDELTTVGHDIIHLNVCLNGFEYYKTFMSKYKTELLKLNPDLKESDIDESIKQYLTKLLENKDFFSNDKLKIYTDDLAKIYSDYISFLDTKAPGN